MTSRAAPCPVIYVEKWVLPMRRCFCILKFYGFPVEDFSWGFFELASRKIRYFAELLKILTELNVSLQNIYVMEEKVQLFIKMPFWMDRVANQNLEMFLILPECLAIIITIIQVIWRRGSKKYDRYSADTGNVQRKIGDRILESS